MISQYDAIIVNGDSYSDKNDAGPVYSDILQNTLGIPVINIAKTGSNNDRITRSTIEQCLELKQQYKKILVVVGWSFVRRMEVWYYGNHTAIEKSLPDQQDLDHRKRLRFVTLEVLTNLNQATLEQKCLINGDLFVHKQLMNFYTNIYLLSQFLKNNNMQYFFFSAANNSEIPIHSFPAIENLDHVQSVIRDNNIYRLHDFYVKAWSDLNDPDSMDLTGHMSVTGHEKFAGFLLNLLNNNLS